jgi:hypothetical protein
MKKTKIKVNYFSVLFVIFFGISLISCGTTQELKTTVIYDGYSIPGIDSRALTTVDNYIIIGGAGGGISFVDLNDDNRTGNMIIEGMEDFRDVHCVTSAFCHFMNSGDYGQVIRMAQTGTKGVTLDTNGVFLNGMDFWNDSTGIIMGDPVENHFFIALTNDYGNNWKVIDSEKILPPALAGEAAFAASGTSIRTVGDSTVYFGTGNGLVARLFKSQDRGASWSVLDTPIKAGESYGIYSLDFWEREKGIIIGGSYIDSTNTTNIAFFTEDGGNSWKEVSKGLPGYISCIAANENGSVVVVTGRMGTYYSINQGKEWLQLTEMPFYSCVISDTIIALSGRDGKLNVYNYSLIPKD